MEVRRNTIQRQLVLNAMKELDIHASAEQVYEYVFKQYPTISKATVYRNLSQLAESGELLNIGSFNGSTHYDHQCHKHYHFMCDSCKRIFDVEGEFSDLSSIFVRLGCTEGFDITGYSISFSGTCWDCKKG